MADETPSKADAYTENLIAASLALDRELQARLAREYFLLLLGVELTLEQSYDAWQAICQRRNELVQEQGTAISFRQAVLEHFARSPVLRDPIITEFGELQRLRRGASTDPLTGAYNRRFFDLTLEKELQRSARYGDDLSLVLMDLNRFKDVNDVHGHAAGDRVLGLTGGLLQELVRGSDFAFRIGGDEFALLLPQTAFPGAVLLAQRIRQRFQESVGALELRVQPSLDYGVATAPREAGDAKALFALADQRLYATKRSAGDTRRAPTFVHPRRFQRIPLERVGAYAILRSNSESHRARLLDFSFSGVGLELPAGVELPRAFAGDLHLPVLAPVSVWLRKVYVRPEEPGSQRVGCAIFRPVEEPQLAASASVESGQA